MDLIRASLNLSRGGEVPVEVGLAGFGFGGNQYADAWHATVTYGLAALPAYFCLPTGMPLCN